MSNARWQHVQHLYHGALERPVSARAEFLHEACAGDAALLNEVQSLLDQPISAEQFLEAAESGIDPPSVRVGQQLGVYQVQAFIGRGGMGEVYRARDTRLGRNVAVKLLPLSFMSDPDRCARFEREARVLATLNHPHIGAIYGLEDIPSTSSGQAAARALVLELVEGDTLADRIANGPLPVGEALTIARQIAEGLEAAHEKGIVHRDLKPSNISVTGDGTVKVLDFGLAKAFDPINGAGVDAMSSPAPGMRATEAGVILGTAAYMSPEQARGRPVDKRTDIWAFGCVLYEMLTGRLAFIGETPSDTLVAILEHTPDWSALPADVRGSVRVLIRRCLAKDRRQRLSDAGDVRLEIDDALTAPPEGLGRAAASRRAAPVAIAALSGGVAIAGLVAWVMMRPVPVAPVLSSRFAIVTPSAQPLNVSSSDRDLALSPDGRHVAYRAGGTGSAGSPLMVRTLDQLDARPLADVTNAYAPFFSPDSQWIGFFESGELKKVSITGGPVITLGPVIGGSLGASWGDDNTIVFATDDPSTGLWRVSADGGEPTVLTKPDAEQHEREHRFPSVLPDSRGVLFTIAEAGQADNGRVAVLDLRTGQWKTLVRGSNQAEYVDHSTGSGQGRYLIYAAADALRAVRFDPIKLDVLSDPVTVAEHVMVKRSGAANYAVSRPGTLVYVPSGAVEHAPIRSLVWVDRKGHEEPIEAPVRAYGPPRISPDGGHVAIGILDQENTEIWIWDLARKTLRRLTFSPGTDAMPLWTPDGRRIVFWSARAGVPNLYIQAADGTGSVDRLTTSANPQWPTSISSDGTRLFGFELRPKMMRGVILVPVTNPKSSLSLNEGQTVQTLFHGNFPEISPDGRYLAYQSNESGRLEVHVRSFPEVDRFRGQISMGGATRPAWARSGRELFYLDESSALIAVPVQTSGPTLIVGRPTRVFDTKYVEPNPARHYDVSPDGQRFLMIKESGADPKATPASMVVVLNWTEELKRLVPTR